MYRALWHRRGSGGSVGGRYECVTSRVCGGAARSAARHWYSRWGGINRWCCVAGVPCTSRIWRWWSARCARWWACSRACGGMCGKCGKFRGGRHWSVASWDGHSPNKTRSSRGRRRCLSTTWRGWSSGSLAGTRGGCSACPCRLRE